MIILTSVKLTAQTAPVLDAALADKLAHLPLHCITQEFPNKTSHSADSATDAVLLPSQLHPAFYGCFDWHSSVHGHWMLVRLLKTFPDMESKDQIVATLNNTFQPEKTKEEAAYFSKYTVGKNYERTYGWAWLLKLDEELLTWDNPDARRWHEALQPLTDTILSLWKNYIPKQDYPNRTGVHPNTAFAMVFALDWARTVKDTAFEHMVIQKSLQFYKNIKAIPAYMEPDGGDFFSPSLEVADLMRRILTKKQFVTWFNQFYEERSIRQLCLLPKVSDRSDYQIVHMDGLYFTRAWCMKGIAASLPSGHRYKKLFAETANKMLALALPTISKENYGGGHWLASFAVYALK
ncbi:DUF2891 domain-containing protein [Taibaiella lutea]|uniref:DUF2891 domain-containing protein n=1 Tax=Taibaiella lutea TaxID=2608001 RepID=A0A5M6CF45_9BACT|nr:DUF2891 domain-containing protein [Taibaiella lutea]KAA5533696.1 DUF2891 domain-containing protein [Taibaiella lutea]